MPVQADQLCPEGDMPWSNSRPRGGRTAPKYRSPEHLKTRAAYAAALERDGYAWCAQPVCVMPSRKILPGSRWCAGHDDTGTRYIGLVHERCNIRDASVRARQAQAQPKPFSRDDW